MTNDLEKQFFDTFGIEPEEEKYCLWECKEPSLEHVPCNKECKYQRHDIYYPQITDRILLELICFIEQIDLGRYCEYVYFCKFNYEDLRTEILAKSIRLAHKKAHSEVNGQLFYNQVRTLFEEG